MEALVLLIIVAFIIWFQKKIYDMFIFNNLTYECSYSTQEAFEGDEISLTEIVHNNKLLPLQWLKVEIFSSKWLSFADTKSVIAQENRFVTSGYHLKNYQMTTRVWKVKCLKRGVYIMENVTLVSGDFLGLLHKSIPMPVNAKLTVFPGLVDIEDMLESSKQPQGDTIVRSWIMDDPFIIAGAKEYAPGDPMNRIHWQATAKQGELMVRKNDFTTHRSLHVILNIQSKEFERGSTINKGLIELGIKIAATLFDRSQSLGIPVGFSSNATCLNDSSNISESVFISPASGLLHFTELLTILAQLELRKTEEFEDWLISNTRNLFSSEVVIITSYLSNDLCKEINLLKAQCQLVKVILLDNDFSSGAIDWEIDLYCLKQVGEINVG